MCYKMNCVTEVEYVSLGRQEVSPLISYHQTLKEIYVTNWEQKDFTRIIDLIGEIERKLMDVTDISKNAETKLSG